MSPSYGSRIGLFGATSLLGRELTKVLKERNFPVSRSTAIEPGRNEPEIPVLEVESEVLESVLLEDLNRDDFDFIFLATPAAPADWDVLMARLQGGDAGPAAHPGPVIISLAQLPPEAKSAVLSGLGQNIPMTDSGEKGPRLLRSLHAASAVLGTLLLRLVAKVKVSRVVAHVFVPASNLGPKAIEELQEQILKLMSFQKIPQAVFGDQVAFNVLPRLGRPARTALQSLEGRIRHELGLLLAGRVPAPAVRMLQVPVFFSTAFSIYIETDSEMDATRVSEAIEGEGVTVRRQSQPAATQVEAAASADILVDVVVGDGSGRSGFWLWAAVDDLRLAAKNAVEIAEQFLKKEILH